MKHVGLFFLACFLIHSPELSFAKSSYKAPLMKSSYKKSRTARNISARKKKRRYRTRWVAKRGRSGRKYYTKTRTYRTKKRNRQWGLRIGTLGKSQSVDSDVLGLDLQWGLKGVMVFSLNKNWYLHPGVGFFYNRSGTGEVGVGSYRAELGSRVYWVPNPAKRTRWLAGGVVAMDFLFSKISAFGASNTSGPSLGLRVGPATGVAFRAGRQTDFLIETELSFDTLNSFRPYLLLNAGLSFAF